VGETGAKVAEGADEAVCGYHEIAADADLDARVLRSWPTARSPTWAGSPSHTRSALESPAASAIDAASGSCADGRSPRRPDPPSTCDIGVFATGRMRSNCGMIIHLYPLAAEGDVGVVALDALLCPVNEPPVRVAQR
jgi:hypothetical protein